VASAGGAGRPGLDCVVAARADLGYATSVRPIAPRELAMKNAVHRVALAVLALAGGAACGGDPGDGVFSTSTTTASTTTTGAGGSGAGGGATGGAGTGGHATGGAGTGGATGGGGAGGAGGATGGATGGAGGQGACGTPAACAAVWEEAASAKLDVLAAGPKDALAAWLTEMPKGADLHNHLSGAVYAETYLGWAKADGDCVNATSDAVVYANQCGGNQPVPGPGAFYDEIVRAWSMKDFVAGAETGHDHFFATFGKFGAVSGAHRNDSLADVLARAAAEHVQYVETMFNLGKNVGALSASIWSGTLTAADLPGLHAKILASASFAGELAKDVQVVEGARKGTRATLGCDGPSPPTACDVGVRFVAQIARTGAKDTVFGQLVGAFEMAMKTDGIVAANLSSPEDDTTSLANYDLHMAMLDYLHGYYAGKSPLHVTLHAGELAPKFLPAQYANAITFHVRKAVELGHAERVGHAVDVLQETDAQGLLAELAQKNVLVEVCLSSNAQILEIQGAAHPLASFLAAGVPVALATDDQGVSRSSLAGEHLRAVVDQHLDYRTLKTMARDSLEHAFLPGASIWTSVAHATPVADCAPTPTMGLGDPPNASCQAVLAGSERAKVQWRLERAFSEFEKKQ
jgi:hypothetical protein